MTTETVEGYGMKVVVSVTISNNQFIINISDTQLAHQERSIYAFVVSNEIVRIGSSKARLSSRLRAWMRDVSKALNGIKSPTSPSDAHEWRSILRETTGTIYARTGTMVSTPVGSISAYLSEEKALIERHSPRFCRR